MAMKTIAQAQENQLGKKPKKPKIVEIDESEPEEEEIPVKFELSESQKKASQRLRSQIREVSLDEKSSKINSQDSEGSRSRPNKRESQKQKIEAEEEAEYEMEEMEEESELPEFNPAFYKSKAISMAMEDADSMDSDDVNVRVMDNGEVWDSSQIRRTIMSEGYYVMFSAIEGVSCKYGRNITGLTARLRASEAIQTSLPYAMDDLAAKMGVGGEFSPSTALLVATAAILAQTFANPDQPLPKQTFPQSLNTSTPDSDSTPDNEPQSPAPSSSPISDAAKARLEQLRKANPDFIFDAPEEAKLL